MYFFQIKFFPKNVLFSNQIFLGESKPQTAAYSTYFGSRFLNATLIQAFTDIESVCERY